jgi:hypothetical protein
VACSAGAVPAAKGPAQAVAEQPAAADGASAAGDAAGRSILTTVLLIAIGSLSSLSAEALEELFGVRLGRAQSRGSPLTVSAVGHRRSPDTSLASCKAAS